MLRAALIAFLFSSPAGAQEFFTLKGHGGPIMDIAVSPTGQIATASFDNSVGVWDGQTPTWFEGHRAAVTAVNFPDLNVTLSAGDDFVAWFWLVHMDLALEIGRHKAKITDIEFHEATEQIATASWDGTVGVWPIETNLDADPPISFGSMFLRGHEQGVNDVAFSDDGAVIYSASVDGTIRVWDVATASETRVLVKHGFGVNTLVVNDTEGWLAYGAVDGGTRIIDIDTGETLADLTLGRRPVLAMAYHPDSHQLAVGDGEGYIMVVDTGTRSITRDFKATQRGPIWALAFSQSGGHLFAGGIEDIMYAWPVATLTEHGQMEGGDRSFLEDPKTLPNGERQFKRKCSICHTLTAGSARKAGPSLHKLFGRPAGAVKDYSYSDTLEGSKIVWSAETINALFDEGPDHYIPGTKMPMQRIVQQKDRDDLIAYLRDATRGD